MTNESDFYETLKQFHGPEKFSHLKRISLFGKNIDLYRFYESAKNKGEPTDAIIITRWREICSDIGLIKPTESLSVKDAHKASKFFCDCFSGFKYPNPDPPNKTRYGRKTKKTTFHNFCDLSYRNADNLKGRKANISEDNLIWMAKNVMCTPKYKLYSNKTSDRFSEDVSTFDDQWVLPSYDTSVCLPYKIQSKVACAAKLATGLMRSPNYYFPWQTKNRDYLHYDNTESAENAQKQEIIRNVIKEVYKYLSKGHDVEICLTIILKALMVASLPQIPGLCKQLALINLHLSEKLLGIHDLKRQKKILHILDILCNILTIVVRDFFANFSIHAPRISSAYHQIILCIDSIWKTSCILLSKVDDSYRKVLLKYNCFTIDTRNIYDDLEGPFGNSHEQSDSCLPGRKLYDKIKCKNHLVDDEDSEKRKKENYKLNYLEIVSNFLLLIKHLTKTSTEQWQFLLICVYIEPFLKFLLQLLMGRKIPDYWFWDDLQDCMRIFLSSVMELCKKMGDKIQSETVVNIYILCVILMDEKRISKTIFRKMIQIILNLHKQFDFHKLEFMRNGIAKACKILLQKLISMPPSRLDNSHHARDISERSEFFNLMSKENQEILNLDREEDNNIERENNNEENNEKDNNKEEEQRKDKENEERERQEDEDWEMENVKETPLYCEEMMKVFDKSFRTRKELKNHPINSFLSPDNPMCNPWCALPWDTPSLPVTKKKKPQSKTKKLDRENQSLDGELEENNNTDNNNNKEIEYKNKNKEEKENKETQNENKEKEQEIKFNSSRYSIDTNSTIYHEIEERLERESTASETEYSGMFGNDEEKEEDGEWSCETSSVATDSSEELFDRDEENNNTNKDNNNKENKEKEKDNNKENKEIEGDDEQESEEEYGDSEEEYGDSEEEDEIDIYRKNKRKYKYKHNKKRKKENNNIEIEEMTENEEKEEEESSINPFYSDTVHVSEKFTMEEAVEYLQRFYKVVFRISEKKLQFGGYSIDGSSCETTTNDHESMYAEFNYRPHGTDMENNYNYSWDQNQVFIDPRNIRVKVEEDENNNTNNDNNNRENNNNRDNNTNNNKDNNNKENNNSSNNKENNREKEGENNQDTHYYDDDQDRPEFVSAQTALIDYDFLNYAKMSKTTKEIICLCLAEMVEFDFCLDIMRKRYKEILECAYSDESAKALWPIIHKLQMELSTIDTETI